MRIARILYLHALKMVPANQNAPSVAACHVHLRASTLPDTFIPYSDKSPVPNSTVQQAVLQGSVQGIKAFCQVCWYRDAGGFKMFADCKKQESSQIDLIACQIAGPSLQVDWRGVES